MQTKFFVIVAVFATALLSVPALSANAVAGLNVSLDKSSSASQNVLAGQTYPLATLNFPSIDYVNYITKLKLHVAGTAGASAIKSVKLVWVNGNGFFPTHDFDTLPVNSDGTVVFDLSDFCSLPRELGGAGCGIQMAGNIVGKGVSLGIPQPAIFRLDTTLSNTSQAGATVGLALDSVTTSNSDSSSDNQVSVSGNLMTFVNSTTETQSITLTYPTDNKITWQWGKTYTIKWTAANVDKSVYVYVIDNIRGQTQTISGPLMANVGSFTFTVPFSSTSIQLGIAPQQFPIGNKYQVKVGNDDVSDISKNYFKIAPSANLYYPYFAINSPAAGATLQPGKSYNIKWIAGNWQHANAAENGSATWIHDITVTTYDDTHTATYSILKQKSGDGFVQSGNFSWKVPKNKTFYKNNKITITIAEYSPMAMIFNGTDNVEWGSVSYDSGVFSIATPLPAVTPTPAPTPSPDPIPSPAPAPSAKPSITVTSPNGGETWYRGETHDITWQSNKVNKVYIFRYKYNSAGKKSGTYVIANNIPASLGKYSWTIPAKAVGSENINVKTTRIVISSAPFGTAGVSDMSDKYFDVAAPQKTSSNGVFGAAASALSAIAGQIKNLFGGK